MKASFLIAFVVFGWYGCQEKTTAPAEVYLLADTELKEFNEFYQRFHQDSSYQMNHIIWPLKGLPTNTTNEIARAGNYEWQRDDWRMHRLINATEGFSATYEIVAPDLVIERVLHSTNRFALMRRFANIGGEWYLIYYAGLSAFEVKEDSK